MNTIGYKAADIEYPKALSKFVEYSIESARDVVDYIYDNGVRCVVEVDKDGKVYVGFVDFETAEPKEVSDDFYEFAVVKQTKHLLKKVKKEMSSYSNNKNN
jgi:hypothetical protein